MGALQAVILSLLDGLIKMKHYVYAYRLAKKMKSKNEVRYN